MLEGSYGAVKWAELGAVKWKEGRVGPRTWEEWGGTKSEGCGMSWWMMIIDWVDMVQLLDLR